MTAHATGEVALWAALACPACRNGLSWHETHVDCNGCGRSYPVDDGIPVFVLEGEQDETKRRQVEWFDHEAAADFEIVRPRGTPPLYSWFYDEKFRRSMAALRSLPAGSTALTVCGGSGMDAEFLARAGFRVVTSDISLGAVRRARERAERHGFDLAVVVADVERLPFADRSVDLVYVHDGLHHLERPLNGLREMARVAGAAVSVTEPARAAVTAVAVRLGLALSHEESGNRVARLTTDEISASLRQSDLSIAGTDRYAMYFRHEPGRVVTLLSQTPFRQLAKAAVVAFNAVAGRIGNKLTVQAVRPRR